MANVATKIQENLGIIQRSIGLPNDLKEIKTTMAVIIDAIIISAAVIFMIMLVFGGITYLTAAGNEEATAKAKRMMIDAVIGLTITLASYAISIFILRQFGFRVPN